MERWKISESSWQPGTKDYDLVSIVTEDGRTVLVNVRLKLARHLVWCNNTLFNLRVELNNRN